MAAFLPARRYQENTKQRSSALEGSRAPRAARGGSRRQHAGSLAACPNAGQSPCCGLSGTLRPPSRSQAAGRRQPTATSRRQAAASRWQPESWRMELSGSDWSFQGESNVSLQPKHTDQLRLGVRQRACKAHIGWPRPLPRRRWRCPPCSWRPSARTSCRPCTPTWRRTRVRRTPCPPRPATRPPLSPGALAAPCRVFPACPAVVPTAPVSCPRGAAGLCIRALSHMWRGKPWKSGCLSGQRRSGCWHFASPRLGVGRRTAEAWRRYSRGRLAVGEQRSPCSAARRCSWQGDEREQRARQLA